MMNLDNSQMYVLVGAVVPSCLVFLSTVTGFHSIASLYVKNLGKNYLRSELVSVCLSLVP